MKKIMIIILLIFSFSFVFATEEEEDLIRLRVIANSNSEKDIKIKFEVKEKLEEVTYQLLKDTKDIKEARKILNNNLDVINSEVKNVLKKEKYPLSYEVNYGLNYFPEKKYKGKKYKEGYYESLVVTLGSGSGDNWWCVLFPPLCLMEAKEDENVKTTFFIKEWLEKYL